MSMTMTARSGGTTAETAHGNAAADARKQPISTANDNRYGGGRFETKVAHANRLLGQRPVDGFAGSIKRMAISTVMATLAWRERRATRSTLEALSDPILKDIGLTRSDIGIISREPSWETLRRRMAL